MDITKLQVSQHIKDDRLDRYVEIQMNTGIGEPVAKFKYEDKWQIITNTGVILITDSRMEFLITLYYVNMNKATAIFRHNGQMQMPKVVYEAIQKNMAKKLVKRQKGKIKMKIEFAQKKEFRHFASLEVGTVFRDPRTDTIHMKTECIDNEGDEINAIDLATGEFDCFPDDAKIYAVEATLNIKEW